MKQTVILEVESMNVFEQVSTYNTTSGKVITLVENVDTKELHLRHEDCEERFIVTEIGEALDSMRFLLEDDYEGLIDFNKI